MTDVCSKCYKNIDTAPVSAGNESKCLIGYITFCGCMQGRTIYLTENEALDTWRKENHNE